MASTIPIDPTIDGPVIWAALRLPYEQDRAFVGYPTCSIYTKGVSTEDAFTGVYTEALTAIFTDIECYHEEVPEELVASSGGLYQPNDRAWVSYSVGAELDHKAIVFTDDYYYRIISQHFKPHSDRLELFLRPNSAEVE